MQAVGWRLSVGEHVEREALERRIGSEQFFGRQHAFLSPEDTGGEGQAQYLGRHLANGAAIGGDERHGIADDVERLAVRAQIGVLRRDRLARDREAMSAGIDHVLAVRQTERDHVGSTEEAALVRALERVLLVDDDPAHVVAVAVELRLGTNGLVRHHEVRSELGRQGFGLLQFRLPAGAFGVDVDGRDGRGDELIRSIGSHEAQRDVERGGRQLADTQCQQHAGGEGQKRPVGCSPRLHLFSPSCFCLIFSIQ